MELGVGDNFSSFAELEEKLKSYQSTMLWKRDSRTIATAQTWHRQRCGCVSCVDRT